MDVTIQKPAFPKSGALAVFARGARLTLSARQADEASGQALTRAVQTSTFNGKKGEVIEVRLPSGLDADRLILVGLGEEPLKPRDFTDLGGKLVAMVQTGGTQALTIALDDQETGGVAAHEAAAELALGARLRGYRFDKYRTREPSEKKPSLKTVTVTADAQGAAEVLFKDLSAVADGVDLSRDLVSEPANVLTPARFADMMQSLESLGCQVEVYGEDDLAAMGFRTMLAVGQGSAAESKLVIIRYAGKSGQSPWWARA